MNEYFGNLEDSIRRQLKVFDYHRVGNQTIGSCLYFFVLFPIAIFYHDYLKKAQKNTPNVAKWNVPKPNFTKWAMCTGKTY